MFQYAAGRSIALDDNRELLLDINAYSHYNLHNGYELDKVFNISPRIANDSDIESVLGVWKNRYLAYVLKKTLKYGVSFPSHMIWEQSFGCDMKLAKIKSDLYLDGYWQSEKYFLKNASQIKKDFIFNFKESGTDELLKHHILGSNSVSIHVRRGDYISNPSAIKKHGVCSLEYYYSAIQLISTQLKTPSFFVFSDDIDWARNNIKTTLPMQFVPNNVGTNSFKDMYFMSQCKHNIIANSSFSWWSAWLNAHPKKLVVSPKLWFLDKTNTSDLIPESWISI